MPQARTAGSSTRKSPAAKSTAAKSPAAKSTAAKSATAKPAAARSTAAKSSTAKSSTAAKSTASKASAPKASAASKTSAASKSSPTAKAGGAAKARPRVTVHVNAEGTQLEAIAERVRKLNERIIEVGREAGESTLTNYEKALKSIATGVSKGPAKDELEWIQHLAASQAKFVRDLTDSLAKAARERLK
jgi:chemotaxis protein histidine kinase CheA